MLREFLFVFRVAILGSSREPPGDQDGKSIRGRSAVTAPLTERCTPSQRRRWRVGAGPGDAASAAAWSGILYPAWRRRQHASAVTPMSPRWWPAGLRRPVLARWWPSGARPPSCGAPAGLPHAAVAPVPIPHSPLPPAVAPGPVHHFCGHVLPAVPTKSRPKITGFQVTHYDKPSIEFNVVKSEFRLAWALFERFPQKIRCWGARWFHHYLHLYCDF